MATQHAEQQAGGAPGSRRVGARRRATVVDRLNAEWVDVARAADGLVASWAVRRPGLRACTTVEEVLASIGSAPDPVLHALLAESADGCRVAARTVLQALLGRLVVTAHRTRTSIDDVVGLAWCRIATYPLQRRPDHILGNLVMDIAKDARSLGPSGGRPGADARRSLPWAPDVDLEALLARRRGPEETSWGLGVEEAPTARRLIVAALDLQLITVASAEVLVSVYVDGLSAANAARRHAVSADVIRYRCSQSARRMRGRSRQLLDVA